MIKHLNIKLDLETHRLLKIHAAKEQKSIQEIIVYLIKQWVKK